MAVKGIFASDAGIQGDKKGDFASGLLQTEAAGMAPLFALTAGMDSADAGDTTVTWFEENVNTGRVNITNNAAAGVTLVVDNDTMIKVNDIFMVEANGEFVFVTAIAGTSATVIRAFAGTSAVSVDGSSTPVPMQRIGTAVEEGSDRPTAQANLGYPRFNYMQIFRNAWDVTGTARKVEFYTGDRVAKNKADNSMFHSEDIERSLMFGRKSIGVRNGQPFRTMDGILTQITTNVTTQAGSGGSVSLKELRNFLQPIFERNIRGKPNERIAFVGNTVLAVLDDLVLAVGSYNISEGEESFGMTIHRFKTPFGTINLVSHPLMNLSPVWTKDLYVLHPGAFSSRYLRRTFPDDYDADGSRAGKDADYGVLTTEMSSEYKAELTGGKFTGIDTPE